VAASPPRSRGTRPAPSSAADDGGYEEWPYLDEELLLQCRSRKICMSCHWFRHHAGVNCIPLLTCQLHQGLLAHGEHLTPPLPGLDRRHDPPAGLVPGGGMSNRRAVVGVMGAGEGASAEAVALAEELGQRISACGWVLLTGGRPAGVMAAASRGAARVEGHLVVGVLPDEGNGDERRSTAELDLALFTGMGKARNVINVLSADVVVICGGGGPGTASEAAPALNAGRPLILLAVPVLWRDFFCSLGEGVETAADAGTCCRLIEA